MPVIETTEQWREDVGIELCQQIEGDLRNRTAWESSRIESRALYYGEGVSRPDIHFDGATDIHLGVVYENIERLVPKMNNAIWNASPKVLVERTPEDFDPEDTRDQEKFINWALEYDIPNLYTTTISWFRNMLLDGVGVVKTRWMTQWRNSCEMHRLKTHMRQGDQMSGGVMVQQELYEKSASDMLDELFGIGQWFLVEDRESEIEVNIIEDRRPVEGVRVVFTGDSPYIDEVQILVYRPILVKDFPEVEIVEAEDLIVPHRTRDLQTARRVTHQHYMMPDEILDQTRDSFDPWSLTDSEYQTLVAYSRSQEANDAFSHANRAFGQLKDDVEGIRDAKTTNESVPIPMYEVYLSRDIDGDGRPEELVLQVCPHIQRVLHVTFLDVLHPHGQRPFACMHFTSPTDRFYVPGLAYYLAPLNMQANVTINQINDRQTVINNPIGFYRPMALPQDPDAIKNLKPGEMIPTPDPGGINFPQWGKAPLSDMSILDVTLGFADRIGSSPILGGSGGGPGGSQPRTARGTLALISEGNMRVDILITQAQREGFIPLMFQLFGLYSTFMPDEKYFWATGNDRKRGVGMMTRKLLRGKFNFIFRGNTVNTNPEVQRILASTRYQVAATNPLYASDPVKFRELLRDFLSAHSEGTSVDRILPDLPGMGAEPHPPMDQKSEIMSMRMHHPIEPLWSDNDAEHMAILEAFSQTEVFDRLDEVAVSLLAMHYNRHAMQMQRKQQMAQVQEQSTGGGEQSIPTDAGFGDLEGGVQ